MVDQRSLGSGSGEPVLYIVDPLSGRDLSADEARYHTRNLVLIAEDEHSLRRNLDQSARIALRSASARVDPVQREGLVSLCVTHSVPDALVHLAEYHKHSPSARLFASLDYNMGHNRDAGERRPTEGLFHDDHFKHFCGNGGTIVMYTGLPEQVKQSPMIMDAQKMYDNLAVFVAQKADPNINPIQVFMLLSRSLVDPAKHQELRVLAQNHNHDLGAILRFLRGQR